MELPVRYGPLRERVEMVKAVALGYGPEAIATWSGRSVRTAAYWLERFVTSGLGALVDAPRAGRPPRATPAYLAALEAAVSTSPRMLGLEFDVWTSERLSTYLAEQTGIRLSPGWLRVLLAQREWVSGRPKLSVRHLRQVGEVAACEAALQAAEKMVAADLEHRELHHEDETHLETNPYICRMWHRRG